MSEATELAISNNHNLYVSPVVGIDDAREKFDMVRQYTAKCLTKDIDYGKVPGVSKPSLLKPGAEKICSLFGLTPRFSCVDKIMNWNGEGNPDSEPFFYFEYRCDLMRGGEFVASCDASCNSWEKKYRYRRGELTCPTCGKPLRKSKQGDGYYCWAKQGGCGATFQSNDPRVANQKVGDVKNFDTAEQVNTYQKMAQKRAFVGATLIACNLSEYYTQDVEDMSRDNIMPEHDYIEADYQPVQQQLTQQQARPAQQQSFDEIEFLKQWGKPDNVSGMSRTNAESMMDDKGQPYGTKDTKSLWYMQRVIQKKLVDPETTDEQKEVYNMKLSAVCEILQCRKMEKTLPEQNTATTYEAQL